MSYIDIETESSGSARRATRSNIRIGGISMAEPKFIRDNGCKEAVCVDAGRVYDSCCEQLPTRTNGKTELLLIVRAVEGDTCLAPLSAFTYNF